LLRRNGDGARHAVARALVSAGNARLTSSPIMLDPAAAPVPRLCWGCASDHANRTEDAVEYTRALTRLHLLQGGGNDLNRRLQVRHWLAGVAAAALARRCSPPSSLVSASSSLFSEDRSLVCAALLVSFFSARSSASVLRPSAICISSDARPVLMPILILSNVSHSAQLPACSFLSVARCWPAAV